MMQLKLWKLFYNCIYSLKIEQQKKKKNIKPENKITVL
jgi:hypothetical protein